MPDRLAIDGGTPVRSLPMPRWPSPGEEEVAAVAAVLRSGRLSSWTGEEVHAFEREYAEALGRKHAIAVANGTLALELALRALRIGPGDEVIVPARTFIATASSVVAVGAAPVVCDIDPESSNMTAESVADAVTERTRAVIPVHVGGLPVEMDPIVSLARDRGLLVIEDCAQAHGATYRGRPVGSLGDAAAFSFCQDKILPVGEGGMLFLDDDAAYERAWAYKDHGKSLRKLMEAREAGPASPTSFCWLVDSFGSNWRLAEMDGALGRVGLRKLPEWVAQRRANAKRLADDLGDVPGIAVPNVPGHLLHSYYRLYARLDLDRLSEGWDRERIGAAIAAEGVPVQYGTCAEIYREPAFEAAGLAPARCLPGAAAAHESSVAFFVHPTLGEAEMDDTAAAIREVMEVATR